MASSQTGSNGEIAQKPVVLVFKQGHVTVQIQHPNMADMTALVKQLKRQIAQ